ncbi:MAG: glycogen synthase [Candidatus Promineifilaceae bacterium]
MSDSLKILFISAEVAPFAKTGGLGDVGGSLPKALKKLGHDVRVVMPAYQSIEESLQNGRFNLTVLPGHLEVPMGFGSVTAGVFEGRLPGNEVPIYFIAERNLLGRPNVYGYDDDPYRFAFFSRAALDLALAMNWRPDVVHAHDWHTAPALTWLATAGNSHSFFRAMPTVFTIHNLAHQGRTSWNIFDYMGLQTHSLNEEGYGEVNFMARGIYHATMVNTVSPTYAREIMTRDGGAHLDGLLHYRAFDVHGILNGIDYDEWNPMTDKRLAGYFDEEHMDGRLTNKRALQARAGLPVRDDAPILAMISRLDWQKGLDITGHVIHLLMNGYAGEAQFIVLGTGAAEYENMFARLADFHRDKMTAFLAYNAGLAPLIYAGSDMFLMPSRFEPCGLGQLIAMRYGSVPVVRATGGLADTVQDTITGFQFHDYSADAFWHGVQRAMYTYNTNQPHWKQIQLNGMSADFSWERSADGYQQLYQWAISRMRGY